MHSTSIVIVRQQILERGEKDSHNSFLFEINFDMVISTLVRMHTHTHTQVRAHVFDTTFDTWLSIIHI